MLRIVADKGQEEDSETDWEGFDGTQTPPDAVSDDEGRFTLPPQTPGRYLLFVEHPFAETHLERNLDLKSGPRLDLDLRVKPAGKVRVRVLDAAGKPVKDEGVVLVRADGLHHWGSSDAEGWAEFESIPAGPCVVRWGAARPFSLVFNLSRAQDEGERTRAYDALRAEAGEHVVRAGAESSITVRLPRRVRTLVRVEPWSDEVKSVSNLWFVTATTDPGDRLWLRGTSQADLRFEIVLEPGAYVVYAEPQPAGWGQRKVFNVEIPDAPTHTLDLGR
jgi:hypothetical protein